MDGRAAALMLAPLFANFQTVTNMKNTQSIILAVVAVVCAAYAGFLHVENGKLKEALASEEVDAEVQTEAEEASEEIVEAVEEVSETVEEVAASDEPQEMTQEERQAERQERRQQMMERMMSRFTDPDMRMDMIEQAMVRIDENYADLFKRLDLAPEEIEAVKTLMAEQAVLRREAQMKAAMAATDEEREAIRESMREERLVLNADMESILGEQGSRQMRTYTSALPYKDSVDEFARSMSYTETPLNARQSEALLRAYGRTSQEFEYSLNVDEMNRWERRNVTPEQMDTYYQEKAEFDALVLAEASQRMNEEQVISLAEKLMADREREQRESEFFRESMDQFGRDRGGFGPGRGGPGGGRNRGGFGGGGGGRGGPGGGG